MLLAIGFLGAFFLVSVLALNSRESAVKNIEPVKTQTSSSQSTVEIAPDLSSTNVSKLVDKVATAVTAPDDSTAQSAPQVEIKDFKRSENKDGKLAWELSGSSAAYEVGGSKVIIKEAKIASRLKSGELATLITPEAHITMSGATLNEAQGFKGVTITLDNGVRLDTPSARYERTSGKVSSNGNITIFHPRGSLTADGFAGNTTNGIFVFEGDVHTTILPAEKK